MSSRSWQAKLSTRRHRPAPSLTSMTDEDETDEDKGEREWLILYPRPGWAGPICT
jgi:hypothetical protein